MNGTGLQGSNKEALLGNFSVNILLVRIDGLMEYIDGAQRLSALGNELARHVSDLKRMLSYNFLATVLLTHEQYALVWLELLFYLAINVRQIYTLQRL